MRGRDEEASVQADAYIDALLAARARHPRALPESSASLPAELRRTIEVLHSRLPRFHPSFVFEESLARRLRIAADAAEAREAPGPGELIALPLPAIAPATVPAGAPAALPAGVGPGFDRRWLLGGAIASGVSICGAMLVRANRRRGRARGRREWLS